MTPADLIAQELTGVVDKPEAVALRIVAKLAEEGYEITEMLVTYAPDYKYTLENPEPGPEAVGQPPLQRP